VLLTLSILLQLLGRTCYLFLMVAATLTMPIECRCGGPVVAPHSLTAIVASVPAEASDEAVEAIRESVTPIPRLTDIPDTLSIGFTIVAVIAFTLAFAAPRAGPPVVRTIASLIPWRPAPVSPPPRPLLSFI
jgi:hypothetical protein